MYTVLSDFTAQLRLCGIPISLTESVDAAAALDVVSLDSRDEVRGALRATLVKNAEHLPAFELMFDLFFSGGSLPPAPGAETEDEVPLPVQEEAEQRGPFADLDPDELQAILQAATDADDRIVMTPLAGEFVTRFAKIVPGRPVAGRAYLAQTLRAMQLEALLANLLSALQTSSEGLELRLRTDQLEDAAAAMRDAVDAEIRRRMVRDRGIEAVARVLRPPPPGAVSFQNASQDQLKAVQHAVRPLGRKLASRLGRTRRSSRRGSLDFRRTLHKSLSTGGIPVELKLKKRRPARPDLVVIADVSSSVAASARFTLELLYGIRSQFTRVKVFAFIDNLVDVSDVLATASSGTEGWREIFANPDLVRGDGHSNYGMMFETFEREWADVITSRTSFIVLGDARNNYYPTQVQSFAASARRARRTYWLNPEPKSSWNSGDSVMRTYAPHCYQVVECRNLDQLKAFADSLDAMRQS